MFDEGEVGGSSEGRDDPALIAALRIKANGGLMPHVRHGGMGKASVATAGSKFDGTGLLNEQIGQTQFPVLRAGVTRDTELALNGLEDRVPGDEEDCCTR